MVSAYWSPEPAQKKVREAVAKNPRRDHLINQAVKLYDTKSAISVKELQKILQKFKANVTGQETQGVFDACGTAYGLSMFDLFTVLMSREEAKHKWREVNGRGDKPQLPVFERGMSREGQEAPRMSQRSQSVMSVLPSQRSAGSAQDTLLSVRGKMLEWAAKAGCSTLFEAMSHFNKEFGLGGGVDGVDEGTFLRGMRRLKVGMAQQQAQVLFQKHDSDRDGRLTMPEFGALLLPGLDRSIPKWFTRKDMAMAEPMTKWEHERLSITAKPGVITMAPISDRRRPPPPRHLSYTLPAPKKCKWGIPWIDMMREGGVQPFVPVATKICSKKPNDGNTTLGLWRGGKLRQGQFGERPMRPPSVEGPPAAIHPPQGATTDERKEFWHEWCWREQNALRKETKMDKLPGGALKVGNAELFAWPPDIMPL